MRPLCLLIFYILSEKKKQIINIEISLNEKNHSNDENSPFQFSAGKESFEIHGFVCISEIGVCSSSTIIAGNQINYNEKKKKIFFI